ncbi:MAG TPA: hypothetical protein PKD83_01990 [Ignavibacteria bacterium]|nr:hypothetical protein [Ignavibacteria bacterium]
MKSVIYKKFFRDSEILSSGYFYEFSERLKIIIFVPESHLNKLLDSMSNAGAGIIGNYEKCSFRSAGTGTFLPNNKAKPFSGKVNEIASENEFKFEMECSRENVNNVINSLLKSHPYEEPAYEIYSFRKRSKKQSGVILDLNLKMKYSELIDRLNKNIISFNSSMPSEFKRIALISSKTDSSMLESAEFTGCECLLEISKNNYKLFKI